MTILVGHVSSQKLSVTSNSPTINGIILKVISFEGLGRHGAFFCAAQHGSWVFTSNLLIWWYQSLRNTCRILQFVDPLRTFHRADDNASKSMTTGWIHPISPCPFSRHQARLLRPRIRRGLGGCCMAFCFQHAEKLFGPKGLQHCRPLDMTLNVVGIVSK